MNKFKSFAKVFSTSIMLLLLSACSSSDDVCEDITLASEQIKQCQVLQRKIVNAKDKPVYRTELERRYENDCINFRLYRDDKQPAICGNKHKIKEIRETAQKEAKQL